MLPSTVRCCARAQPSDFYIQKSRWFVKQKVANSYQSDNKIAVSSVNHSDISFVYQPPNVENMLVALTAILVGIDSHA